MISSRALGTKISRGWQCWRCSFSTSSIIRDAETRPPPLLAQLRTDMKEALKAKDKTRGILTETTSLEKESKGVKTNTQLFKLLQRRRSASLNAAKEFQNAGRDDLTDQENQQIGVLQGYLDGFDTTSADEVVAAIQTAIRELEANGVTPKRERVRAILYRSGGAFQDKIIDNGLVTKTIHRLVHEVAPSQPSPVQA
ncbi:MAG: hypothetical protein Q9224_002295 [Gallowayella concinna]